MKIIINTKSTFFCPTKEDRIKGAIHNSKILGHEELLDAYLSALLSGNKEEALVYKNVILNKLHDSDILYNILDNI